MSGRDGSGFFSSIGINPFTCESHCPRTNYLPLSVQFAFVRVLLRVYWMHTACVTLFFPLPPPSILWEVWVIGSLRVWETSPRRKPSWIGFRAGSRGGPGCGGRQRAGTHRRNLSAFSAQRVALSNHLWEVGEKWVCVCVGGVIPLPQVRWWTGERSHYEERWALSALPSCSFPSNLGGECASGSAFASECERRWNSFLAIMISRLAAGGSSLLGRWESVLGFLG